ncbi:MobF family relaxase [Ferrimicrobium sp.]|uniref:MobF family relaxase n=1 Tax=Ferrimicrobium sp. TaxID=2926050 RepID=UPI00261C868A|nr:MobF family relaxase [Ferrimicrobium sp.]
MGYTEPQGVGVRLFKIRGSLDYYAARELSDEPGVVQRIRCVPDGYVREPTDVQAVVDSTQGVRFPIKALDLTIAAPKSLSVRWALATDDERVGIERAHHEAVAETLALMLAFDTAKTARGGAMLPIQRIQAFDVGHRLSRAGDPHLHSHLVVANIGFVDEGRAVALGHARWERGLPVYELAYRVELAARLRPLDIDLIGQGLGTWQVLGQQSGLNEVFSKRRAEVLALRTASDSSRARQLAVLATREPKVLCSGRDLRQRWEAEARELPTSRSQAVISRSTRVRVNDPLLNEVALALEGGAAGIRAARELALRRAFGAVRADQLRTSNRCAFGDNEVVLDGTACGSYRALSVAERLSLMDTPLVNLQLVQAPREVAAMTEALDRVGLKAGSPVNVTTRTTREQTLVATFGQYRQSIAGSALVVDANTLAPSELGQLVAERHTIVREPGVHCSGDFAAALIGFHGNQGRALIVAERSGALWDAFVADCCRWIQSGCTESVSFNAASPGLMARLRREVAVRLPDEVAGHVGARPLFRDEPVLLSDGREGRLKGIDHAWISVELDDTTERLQVGSARFSGFGPALNGRDAIVYGPQQGADDLVKRAYVGEPGLSDLVKCIGLAQERDGVHWIQDEAVAAISRARLHEFERTGGRLLGERLYRLRAATTTLSRIYDTAAEFGFDQRHGWDRIIDERLALSRDHLARGRVHGL